MWVFDCCDVFIWCARYQLFNVRFHFVLVVLLSFVLSMCYLVYSVLSVLRLLFNVYHVSLRLVCSLVFLLCLCSPHSCIASLSSVGVHLIVVVVAQSYYGSYDFNGLLHSWMWLFSCSYHTFFVLHQKMIIFIEFYFSNLLFFSVQIWWFCVILYFIWFVCLYNVFVCVNGLFNVHFLLSLFPKNFVEKTIFL